MDVIGPGAHIIAVCQPSVPALAAVALMSAEKHPSLPATLTMMGGPIDTREAPTAVNELATTRPHSWFEQNVIATVPYLYPGAGRRVYPGFLQLAGRSEEPTSELQSLMRISYAVFCLKKKKK